MRKLFPKRIFALIVLLPLNIFILFYFTNVTSFASTMRKEISTRSSDALSAGLVRPTKSPIIEFNETIHMLKGLLQELDSMIHDEANVTDKQVFGNIFSGEAMQQAENYMRNIRNFQHNHKIDQICEVGFAGGHSALLFLYATNSTNASYLGFDDWSRAAYKDVALKFVKRLFPGRKIEIVKGNSVSTVNNYKREKTCDLIHIDGAHHAQFPKHDLFHMSRLASADNLLLIDDCTSSWPAVLQAVSQGESQNLFKSTPKKHIAEGWVVRNSQKGWCTTSYRNQNIKSLMFLGKEFCIPPYTGQDCKERADNAICSPLDDSCYYNDVYGVASVGCQRWFGAQSVEKTTWFTRDTDSDRNQAHAKSFNNYIDLPHNLGHVLEIGSGPFTQSKTIYSQAKKQMLSITLNEPMAFKYMDNVKNCFYRNGTFANIPTTILGTPAEDIKEGVQYDTIVMINVIEHVYDAFTILNKALNLLKPGGTFVWHERLWNAYKGKASSAHDREFALHPIRIKTVVAELIMQQFETLYFTNTTAELKRLKNDGAYFIGKRKQDMPTSRLPEHEKCVDEETPDGRHAIFIVSTASVHISKEYILKATSGNVTKAKSITLVLSEALTEEHVKSLVSGVKNLRLLISHLHFHQWRDEASKYIDLATSCLFRAQSGELEILSPDHVQCTRLVHNG